MRHRGFAVLLGLAVLAGCQDDKPKGDLPPLHPATGKVVRGGQPVSGGSIRFKAEPDTPDVLVTAEVQANGTFELQTIHALSQKKGSGAPVGTYRATYTPALGDQVQGGGSPVPVTPNQTYVIQAGPNDLTVEIGKK